MQRKYFYQGLLIVSILAIIILGCGKDFKTPADIKDKVAWLDAESAMPLFPFGTNPIYMMFHSADCPVTNAMLDEIFSRPEMIKYLNEHFTCISVMPDSIDSVRFVGEMATGKRLLEAFKVEGYPSHYFFNAQGFLKTAHTGYIELRVFKQLLKYVAEGYVEKYTLPEFMEMPEAKLDTIYGEW
jgi:thioredoxin-related protein